MNLTQTECVSNVEGNLLLFDVLTLGSDILRLVLLLEVYWDLAIPNAVREASHTLWLPFCHQKKIPDNGHRYISRPLLFTLSVSHYHLAHSQQWTSSWTSPFLDHYYFFLIFRSFIRNIET